MMLKFATLSRILVANCNSVSFDVNFLKKSAPLHRFFRAYQSSCCMHLLQKQTRSLSVLQTRLEQLNISTIPSREKSSKRHSSEYESESDSEDEIEKIPGSKLLQIRCDSLRCDIILKQGLGIARNKLEVIFYEGRIRVNGKKIQKKSVDVRLGDEVDIIKGISEDNPALINVSRVDVLKARPTGDVIILTIRRTKNLLIENYETDPWEEAPPEQPDKNFS